MSGQLRVGVVGVGHMGSYHVAALSELLDYEIVAVCDLEKEETVQLRFLISELFNIESNLETNNAFS